MNNAGKFTAAGGKIEVSAGEEDGQAVIRVRDSGVGIEADDLSRVFDLFTQVDRGLAHSRGGLGIGLTLARNLVEMHGGRIEAHSPGVGRGSEFTIKLPLAKSNAGELGGTTPPRTTKLSPRRILVVDDNRDVAESLAMLLESIGMRVRVAYDGQSALEAAAAFRPEVLFVDLGMPTMDGYETARHLRRLTDGDDFFLVALTGWGQEDNRRRSRDAGFDEHLTKPVDLKVLEGILTRRR
jgi:CheY-like chemotaxis protein